MVVSLVLMVAGLFAGFSLPIKQYPDVAPPTIMVFANYPGADAATLSNTVAAPLEEAMNGVENMIFMSSTSGNTGNYSLVITFKTGTDTNMALVNVQNRILQISPLLPNEVTQNGINTLKTFSNMLGFAAVASPNGTRDQQYLLDYAYSNVANVLKRVPGLGDVRVFGARYSIRVWLDPERLASLGLSTSDVASAVSSQNRQASIGALGAGMGNTGAETAMVYSLTTRGRLSNVRDFEEVVIRTTTQGGQVKLKDVARIELGAESYGMNASLNGNPVAMMMLSQAADANALDVMKGVRETLESLESNLPNDVEFIIGYDSTDFVRATIYEILFTLGLTFTLVVLICYIFLQDWRVTLVPAAAIPTSLLAAFIGLSSLGFSVNILTLFGLVLAIGSVVDDAILVVERVMFVMERDKSSPVDATIQAMKDVTGPMIATTLVFLAIFAPIIFMQSITGIIYRQFAVTISFALVFSLIVALTLSPAMCAHMLGNVKPKQRGPLAWFNSGLLYATKGYVKGTTWIARKTVVTLLFFAVVAFSSFYMYTHTRSEFLPDEDQGAMMCMVQLPEGASQSRTREAMGKIISQATGLPGVKLVMSVEGFTMMGSPGENVGMIIVALENWRSRKTSELSQMAIMNRMRGIAAGIPEAQVNVFAPPSIQGLGIAGGLQLELQSRIENDPVKLEEVMKIFLMKTMQSPEFLFAFSPYTANTPHMYVDIDREKAEMMGLAVSYVFSALQTYFGTAYINDINIGTQVNKVILQSDWMFRDKPDSLGNIHVRSSTGARVPVDAFATVKRTLAPRAVTRYNLYPSAAITVLMKPGFSTGQGIARIEQLVSELPEGYVQEWTGMTYQEKQASGQTFLIILAALLFGYLFLVAQYESWTVPIGVLLSLPVALLGALVGIYLMKLSLSIYAQLGILLLAGLAGKNAILIIEFAQEKHEVHGLSILDAAAQAGRERFRSVMMTALTTVIGVSPMLFAHGAGAASRLHVGTTIFFGMSLATALGIFLIPGLYTVLQKNRERAKRLLGLLFSGNKEAVKHEPERVD
jgi:hydrophobe/amphiphile efflux-1 (HAE1) family protein